MLRDRSEQCRCGTKSKWTYRLHCRNRTVCWRLCTNKAASVFVRSARCSHAHETVCCCEFSLLAHCVPSNLQQRFTGTIKAYHRRRLFFFFFLGQRTSSLPPFHPISSPSLLSFPLSAFLFPFFRSGPLNTSAYLGERCKLPQWGQEQNPSRQTICCIMETKSASLVAAVFVDFSKNKCNFLHKNRLQIIASMTSVNNYSEFIPWNKEKIVAGCNSSQLGRRPMRSFSPGAVATICSLEVGAYKA